MPMKCRSSCHGVPAPASRRYASCTSAVACSVCPGRSRRMKRARQPPQFVVDDRRQIIRSRGSWLVRAHEPVFPLPRIIRRTASRLETYRRVHAGRTALTDDRLDLGDRPRLGPTRPRSLRGVHVWPARRAVPRRQRVRPLLRPGSASVDAHRARHAPGGHHHGRRTGRRSAAPVRATPERSPEAARSVTILSTSRTASCR